MSEHLKHRWFVGRDDVVRSRVKVDGANFVADCGNDDESNIRAKRIVVEHNACVDIPDPVSTIPKLVEFARAHHEFSGFLIKGQSDPTPI